MKITKNKNVIFASGFSIFMGLCFIGLWTFFFAFYFIPEIHISIFMLVNSVFLIWGGILLALGNKFGKHTWYFATSMLLYALSKSLVFAIHQNIPALVALFGVLLLIIFRNIFVITKGILRGNN